MITERIVLGLALAVWCGPALRMSHAADVSIYSCPDGYGVHRLHSLPCDQVRQSEEKRAAQRAQAEEAARLRADRKAKEDEAEAQRLQQLRSQREAVGLQERALAPDSSGEKITCAEFSRFVTSKGHGFFERAVIVEDARKRGACKW